MNWELVSLALQGHALKAKSLGLREAAFVLMALAQALELGKAKNPERK